MRPFKPPPPRNWSIAGTTSDHEGVKGLVKFKGIARIKMEGGSLSANDTALTVKGANAATIYISIATNFNNYQDISGDENARATAYLEKAYPKPYKAVAAAHVAAYEHYFNRVKLDLGSTAAAKLPTDQRLQQFSYRQRPATGHAVLPVWPLSVDFFFATRRAAGQPAGHLEP